MSVVGLLLALTLLFPSLCDFADKRAFMNTIKLDVCRGGIYSNGFVNIKEVYYSHKAEQTQVFHAVCTYIYLQRNINVVWWKHDYYMKVNFEFKF